MTRVVWRVAQSAFGAALVSDFELELHCLGRCTRQRQPREYVFDVNLGFAEELVELEFAFRQVELAKLDVRRKSLTEILSL